MKRTALALVLMLSAAGPASARWYSGGTGRFLSEDQLGVTPERMRELKELNGFGYAGCNPARWTDPSGLEPNRSQAVTAQQVDKIVEKFFLKTPPDLLRLRYAEKPGGGGRQVGPFGGDKGGRYIWTSKRGWIDLGHFFQVAAETKRAIDSSWWKSASLARTSLGRARAKAALWEKTQEIEDLQKAKGQEETAWSYEDPSSNEAGLDFFLDYYTDDAQLREGLARFFEDAGAGKPQEAPNWTVMQQESIAKSGHGWFEKAPRSMEPVLNPKRVWWPKKNAPKSSTGRRAPKDAGPPSPSVPGVDQ